MYNIYNSSEMLLNPLEFTFAAVIGFVWEFATTILGAAEQQWKVAITFTCLLISCHYIIRTASDIFSWLAFTLKVLRYILIVTLLIALITAVVAGLLVGIIEVVRLPAVVTSYDQFKAWWFDSPIYLQYIVKFTTPASHA